LMAWFYYEIRRKVSSFRGHQHSHINLASGCGGYQNLVRPYQL
jgi:hypothetical protein